MNFITFFQNMQMNSKLFFTNDIVKEKNLHLLLFGSAVNNRVIIVHIINYCLIRFYSINFDGLFSKASVITKRQLKYKTKRIRTNQRRFQKCSIFEKWHTVCPPTQKLNGLDIHSVFFAVLKLCARRCAIRFQRKCWKKLSLFLWSIAPFAFYRQKQNSNAKKKKKKQWDM